MKTASVFLVRAALLRAFALLVVSALLPVTPAHALDITVAPSGNIQSAIDQVNAAGGGNVILQAGTYTVTATLQVRSNVTLKGAGTASTTIQNTDASSTYSLIGGPSDGISALTIRDLALDGQHSANGLGIFFDGTYYTSYTNLNLINLEVRNFSSTGLQPKGVTGLTQTNNYVHDNGSLGWCHNEYFRRISNMNVSGCRFDNSPGGDGAKFTLWDGITVTNCTFTGNNNRGLRTQETNTNGSFTYNTTIGNRWDGMEITGDNVLIDHNAAYGNGTDTTSSYRNGIRTPGAGCSGTVSNNNSYNNPHNYDIHGTFNQPNNTTNPPSFSVIQGESYSTMSGVQLENCSDTGGGQDVGYINNGDNVVFNSIDLTGATGLDARVASTRTGSTIEVHLDSVTGPLVGTLSVPLTGGFQTWATTSGAIQGASGIHNVCLVFKGGTSYLFNVNWVQFK